MSLPTRACPPSPDAVQLTSRPYAVSALRRACGPGSDRILLNCPAHLLYGAKQVIDPHRLPPRVLAIAGGRDGQVPYSQAVLVASLLTGVGVRDVRQRLYREETHLGSLASLVRMTRYSTSVFSEVVKMVEE